MKRVTRVRGESGVVAVVVAVMALAMFVVAAMVIDLGAARDTRRQSQNAADASALAGANVLYPLPSVGCKFTNPDGTKKKPCLTDAIRMAQDYAQGNFGVDATQWSGCTDNARPSGYAAVTGQTACISFDSLTAPHRVRVKIPTRDIKTGLGALAGVQQIPVTSSADASIAPGAAVTCSLCFLSSVDAGNGDFTVNGGSIAVNGHISAGKQSNWTASSIGYVSGTPTAHVFTPQPTIVDAFTDPLADLSLPLSTTGLSTQTNPCSQGPGIYNDDVSLSNNDTCHLDPGLYVVNGTWSEGNHSKFIGSGVTLYVKTTGALDFKNGDVSLSAPLTTSCSPTCQGGAYANLAVVYDRDNTSYLRVQGNGGNTSQITGTVYAPGAELSLNGNSKFIFGQGPIIVGGLDPRPDGNANGTQSGVIVNSAVDTTLYHKPGDVSLDQ